MNHSIEEVLASLSPKTRERVRTAQDVAVSRLETPSVGLNLALNGGLGFGRQSLIWGNKSAGKSSFCLQLIGDAQKQGYSCAWIDSEQSFDPAWAARLGVDSKNLGYSNAKAISRVTDDCVDMIQGGIDLMVVDSVSALIPRVYFDDDEMKNFEDTGQIGSFSRDVGKMVQMLNGVNENTMIIFISQQRTEIGRMFTKMAPMGGQALRFYSSTVLKFWSSESDAKAIKAKRPAGDKLIEEVVGRPVNWEVEFNKLGPMGKVGEYDFYFQGENVGVDRASELITFGEMYGIIQKGGAWYTIGEERFQGKPAACRYLRDNPDEYQRVYDELYAKAI